MNQAFKNIDETKQKRILNAAMKEFAEKGYEQASTNKIIKDAGIGKGMLFHYFNNKKDLYEYLVDYAITVMHDEYLSLIDTNEVDFIERMKQIAQVKWKYIAQHPNVSNFIAMVYLSDEVLLPEELDTRLADLQKTGYALIYKNVDQNLLRHDVDVDKAFQLIRWAIEGYQNELMRQFQGETIAHIDLQPYWDEFYEYLDVLKTTFYKEG
ncbi:TetR/AcrR family transcriptional regulator [Salicibibacter cibarius]|uniref:TetR/AcrR family transcriptional regulator n=1 Tax=Salicibibacter cibarius TaxID=2743000 RepID=A0A7T7CAY6_9BACI|nr:TetR/AcrR family transcriptional regulator [Salicibibacter cibarius]QQK75333.1 TetR/AcrR family transcriptional regulator [Salicibibacter cibarius]